MQRRQCLGLAGWAIAAGLGACVRPRAETNDVDAIVTRLPGGEHGAPAHDSIASALRAAASSHKRPFRILIDAGHWYEKLVIDTPDVHFIGRGQAATRLHFDAAAGQLKPDGTPWGTWGCATLIVRAPGFRAERMTIENSFDYLDHLIHPRLEQVGANGAQAVALMLDQGADRVLLEQVDLVGHQDTLFVDAGRSRFRDCRISGSVDFVFGAGTALLHRCDVHSRFRPGKERQGYVAAPSTSLTRPQGLCFIDCTLSRDADIPDRSVALGRAWRPTKVFPDGSRGDPDAVGAALFMRCRMDAHIAAEGWDPMAYSAGDGSRVMLEPRDARFFEFANHGPGAAAHLARPQLAAADAARIEHLLLSDDWIPNR